MILVVHCLYYWLFECCIDSYWHHNQSLDNWPHTQNVNCIPKVQFWTLFLIRPNRTKLTQQWRSIWNYPFHFQEGRFKAEIVIYKWQGGFGDTSSWKHKHYWPWWADTRDSLLIHFHLKTNLDKTFVVTNVKILNWGHNCCRPRPEHVLSLTTDLDSIFLRFCLLRYLSPQHIWFHCKPGWCLRSINIIMTHGIV